MSLTINIDRFTRLNQSISGKFSPTDLTGLAEYIADGAGEINYTITGNLNADLAGGQVRQVKCIIQGWFLLSDPMTLAAVRHTVDISSVLVLVSDESELPPLEMESENEDFIVCGANMNVAERVEEEILLSLPAHAVNRREMIESRVERSRAGKVVMKAAAPNTPIAESNKISPFAKLAELKKK